MKREKTDYIVQSVYNALDILESFKDHQGELDISTIRDRFDLSKNTITRLLATLEKHGYVEENPYTKNYRLGLKNFEVSQAYLSKIDLLKITEPLLEDIVERVNESAYIGVLRGRNVVYLNCVETTQAVRLVPRVGNVGSAFCTAVGKAQLIDCTDTDLMALLKDAETMGSNCSGRPVRYPDEFLEEMKLTRDRGYAIDDEDFEEGVRCIAGAVRDYTGKIVAGISVSGPVQRMSDARISDELAPLIKRTTCIASRKMGFNCPLPDEETPA